MTPEQIAQLLQYLTMQNAGVSASPYFNIAAARGVTPSTLSNVFNPEMLVASGALNPNVISEGISGVEQQLMAEFLAKQTPNINRPYEATLQSLSPYTGKYGIAATEAGMGNVQFAPNAADDLSGLMAANFQAIASGRADAKGTNDAIDILVANNDPRFAPYIDRISEIKADINNFEKAVNSYRSAVPKYEYDVQQAQTQAAASGVAPTRTQAMAKYYEQIGMPQLALLGDPTATYQIPAGAFVNPTRAKALEDEVRRLQSSVAETERRYAPMASEASLQAQRYAGRGAQDEARRRADAAVEGMKTSYGWLEDPASKLMNYASQIKLIGPLFGGDSEAEMRRKKNETWQREYEKALRELTSEPVKPVTIQDVAPQYQQTKNRLAGAQTRLENEQRYADELSRLISTGLASQGITPFNAQLQQMLGYAIQSKGK